MGQKFIYDILIVLFGLIIALFIRIMYLNGHYIKQYKMEYLDFIEPYKSNEVFEMKSIFTFSKYKYVQDRLLKNNYISNILYLLPPLLYLLVFRQNGYNIVSILYCLFTSTLILLSIIDFKTYEIPIEMNLFIGVLGIIRVVLDLKQVETYLIGFICVSGFLFFIYIITKGKGIGGGDIKLMAVSGLLLGYQAILVGFLLGCIIGSIIHILRCKISHKDHILAFGPYLSIGMFLSILYGDQIITWYLGFY